MYTVLVKDIDGDEYLLPGDEYPGTVYFIRLEDAREIAKNVVGLGIQGVDDDWKVVSSRVVQLIEVDTVCSGRLILGRGKL